MPEQLPDEDVAPPTDPFEAELVAYLDGELDPVAARRVETRLASDPHARSKAAALKKTFELLDYLPKPEPSANFTSRTLDKLPPIPGASPQQPAKPASSQAQAKSSRASQPVPTSGPGPRIPNPVARPQGLLPLTSEPVRSRRWAWAAGVLLAMTGFATAGYLGGHALRSPPPSSPVSSSKEEELALSDRRLIENLPLYALVDDSAFVSELAKPEYFGDVPTVAYDSTLKMPSIQREMPSGTAFATLEKAFKQLSPERQQVIRELDKTIYAAPPATQDKLLRVMEAYAVWFNLLSKVDRNDILSAATPAVRLKQIRTIRDRQWVESLPPSQQQQLSMAATDALRNKLIEEWKLEESRRRSDWAGARKNPDKLDAGKIPWPFNDETLRNEIEKFARATLRLDESKFCRLTSNDLDRYNSALSSARANGGVEWYTYGKVLYELVKKPDHEELLLPPPAESKLRYTTFLELPGIYQKFAQQRLYKKLSPQVGKWPEFPLELHKELHKDIPQFHQFHKEGKGEFSKIDIRTLPPLGPARLSDFAQPVRSFVETEMLNGKLLNSDERRKLLEREGKWPEYPRELIQLARDHNLSIPGLMLPGSPKQWESQYGMTRGK